MDTMYYLITICFALVTVNDALDNPIQRWVTQAQLPTSWKALNTSRNDAFPADTEGATLYERSLMYVILTKQVLVVPKKEAVTTTTTPAPEESTDVLTPLPFVNPPPGYKYLPVTGNLYKFHENGAPWEEAERTCEREGAFLVVIEDAVEAVAVIDMIEKAGHRYTWIGLRDTRSWEEIDWRTIRGNPMSAVYNHWDVGRPYTTGNWTCAYLYDNKFLYDSPCDVPNPFTCEIGITEVSQSFY